MKSDELLDAIGEARDEYVHDVRNGRVKKMPGWAKWTSAIAACLVLAIGINLLFGGMGGNAGSGADDDLTYMAYYGPVLPLTIQGDPNGITASRNLNFDFSSYNTYQECYEHNGKTVYYDRYDSEAHITDAYVLQNESGEDVSATLLYPFIGNMKEWEFYPEITVDGQSVSTVMNPGPDSGGFEVGSENLELDCFEGYQALLGDGSYLSAAFAEFPEMDAPVTVYRLHDYVYSETAEDGSPTLSMDFYIDYEKTYVFSYGMEGGSFDYETGFCSRNKGSIEYRPNVAENRQHPSDGYVILLGEDLDSYTIQGYKDGGCDEGEELNDLGCTVTRYECTLGEILTYLMDDYIGECLLAQESLTSGNVDASVIPPMELYYNLTAELLDTCGWLGDFPVERYDSGMLEEIFAAVCNDGRVIYLSFDVTIPAGESITIEAAMRKDASIDYVGDDKDKDGYDMATKLGSNLVFTEQTASICGYDEIEIVAQNFGFDLANSITSVILDPNQAHYWMEIRKVRSE